MLAGYPKLGPNVENWEPANIENWTLDDWKSSDWKLEDIEDQLLDFYPKVYGDPIVRFYPEVQYVAA